MEQLSSVESMDRDKTFNAICDALSCEGDAPAWPDTFGAAISKWLQENNIPKIRTLSLFSGAGGLDIGFSDIGFEIVESVEIERKFCETLELNTGAGKRFPNSKVNCVDIRSYSGRHLKHIDFIIGGPPCQTFSAAGRRANGVLGTSDARGVLFREYVRLLTELSPKGFLFENVYGIIGAQNGTAWEEIRQAFSKVGYRLFYRIVDAADYGVPQHRERIFIIGLKEGEFKFPRPTHGPDSIDKHPFYNAETAIEGVVSRESLESNRLGGRFAGLLDSIPPGLNYSFYTEEMGHPNPIFTWRSKFSDFLYKADPNAPVRTIKASGGAYTGPLHWDNRYFSYEEYKRLQTFPDDYEISGKKQIAVKQIGNSVPPQLARMMAIAIRNQVFGTNFPFTLALLNDGEELTFRKRKRDLSDVYRKKAEMAIKALKREPGSRPESYSYYCSLSPVFNFKEVEKDQSTFAVSVNWGNHLRIEVADTSATNDKMIAAISIEPVELNWAVGVPKVELILCSKVTIGYTVAWKAFENEIIKNSIKADLIQLSGYYQYAPKIKAQAQFSEEFPFARVIMNILKNNTIPRILTTKQLSEAWGIEEEDVFETALYLRSIGYEIRNHSTNPQIEDGCWLVPYIFPTLTPLSVQLWKKL